MTRKNMTYNFGAVLRSIVMTAVLLMIAVPQTHAANDDIVVNIDRQGRRIQLDGFLLEWDQSSAARWGESPWSWDAVITPEGAAGYFTSGAQTPCSSWTFKINTVDYDNDKAFSIQVPETIANNYFAFNKDSFEKNGTYAIEWLVPWDAFSNDEVYVLVADAQSACGEELQSLLIFINPEMRSAKNPYYYAAAAVCAAALLAAGIVYGKKRGKGRKE